MLPDALARWSKLISGTGTRSEVSIGAAVAASFITLSTCVNSHQNFAHHSALCRKKLE
jgi:hypothetical protein